jgi:hypothetical protein
MSCNFDLWITTTFMWVVTTIIIFFIAYYLGTKRGCRK